MCGKVIKVTSKVDEAHHTFHTFRWWSHPFSSDLHYIATDITLLSCILVNFTWSFMQRCNGMLTLTENFYSSPAQSTRSSSIGNFYLEIGLETPQKRMKTRKKVQKQGMKWKNAKDYPTAANLGFPLVNMIKQSKPITVTNLLVV